MYNPQNHSDEFLKRNGSAFFRGLKTKWFNFE